jgi:hypothetical protein
MLKSLALVSLFASAAALGAQSTDPALVGDPTPSAQPAPIIRAYQSSPGPQASPTPEANPAPYENSRPGDPRDALGRRYRRPGQQSQIVDLQPVSGVWLRSDSASALKTISATPQRTEVRLEHGRLNVNVHHPADHAEILIDLPGGQTSLLKDGLYTFNADTNTVRVLHGEAAAFPAPRSGPGNPAPASQPEKTIKIKEDREFAFNGAPGTLKPVEAYPYELSADLLPLGNGDGRTYADYSGDDGPYGYPYYPYPYYAGLWGYPYYGYGYPYGFYPYAVGIGFGYYGGFHGGFRR